MAMKSTPPMGKEKSDKPLDGASGGSTRMFGKSGAAPQVAGVSARPSNAPFAKDAPKGGSTGVMGKQRSSAPARPGGQSPGGSSVVSNTFGVKGGNGHMAGPSGASPAKPC